MQKIGALTWLVHVKRSWFDGLRLLHRSELAWDLYESIFLLDARAGEIDRANSRGLDGRVHSDPASNLLTCLGAEPAVSSENSLKSLMK